MRRRRCRKATGFHQHSRDSSWPGQSQGSTGTIFTSYFGTRSIFSGPSTLKNFFFTITSPQGGWQRQSGGGACQGSRPRTQAYSHVIE